MMLDELERDEYLDMNLEAAFNDGDADYCVQCGDLHYHKDMNENNVCEDCQDAEVEEVPVFAAARSVNDFTREVGR
jgi:hypothetical protein